MKIDFLVGENPYGSTIHFAKAFASALQQEGAQTRLHWIGEGHFFHAFQQIREEPPDFTCSFSDIHLDGTPLGALWQIPHLSLLVDPAIYFLHQLKGKNSWVSCVDEGDVAFVRSLGFERAFYMPHAADHTLLTSPHAERPYDVVFFGSCSEPPASNARVKQAAARVLSTENLSILQALMELDVSQDELPGLHMEVDLYTRFHDRINLLKALKSHTIHIWGNGPWEKYLPHAVIHPPIPFEKSLEVMKEAKVVVNSSPRFKQGLHERILYGALCGAAILSAHPGGYSYTYGEYDDQPFDDWESVAEEWQASVFQKHTWEQRAQLLINQFGA